MARYSYRYDEWFLTQAEEEWCERQAALDEDEPEEEPEGTLPPCCDDPDCDECNLGTVAGTGGCGRRAA